MAIASSAFERLPKELQVMIFTEIPDIDSLVSIVLSGPIFYEAFRPDETVVAGKVFTRQLQNMGVLEDAALSLQAMPLPRDQWTPERIQSHFDNRAALNYGTLERQRLSEALDLGRFHRKILDLAEDIASTSLHRAEHDHISRGSTHTRAGDSELARIVRALYRFELYCGFFGNHKFRNLSSQNLQREIFWSHYAPWEIEQIACVMEYFSAKLLKVFEDLGMKQPRWTQFFFITDTLGRSTEEFLQAQIAHGIGHIHRLIFTHAQGAEIVMDPPLKRDTLTYDENFLAAGLDVSVEGSWGWTLSDIESDPEAQKEVGHIIKAPMTVEADAGPEKAWRWAHQDEVSSLGEEGGFARSSSHVRLRACGYVFWNESRLEEWELMKEPFPEVDWDDIAAERERALEARRERIETKRKEFNTTGRLA